jgi:hypothetical protein
LGLFLGQGFLGIESRHAQISAREPLNRAYEETSFALESLGTPWNELSHETRHQFPFERLNASASSMRRQVSWRQERGQIDYHVSPI